MNTQTLGRIILVWSLAVVFDWINLSPTVSLLVTGALLLAYLRAVDREIDAVLTQQYTGNTTPERES